MGRGETQSWGRGGHWGWFEGAQGRLDLGAEWAGRGVGPGLGTQKREGPEWGGEEEAGTPPTF